MSGSIVEQRATLVWGELSDLLTTALPFRVTLTAENENKEKVSDYSGKVTITAVTSKLCLSEGFEKQALGLWTPNNLPGHYEHGFDSQICAPGSSFSLYLRGGNDSNFGMTLKLPAPSHAEDGGRDTPVRIPDGAEAADASVFDGKFRPGSVSFYVRTDNEKADAGHFILGESNEVNKRVAQFQFTKDGKMGLLGTGGTTHGATPYEPNRWYLVELRFDWDKKQVAFYVDHSLQQRHIPFRREASSHIGACALGNRDRCTTWFDSIRFVREKQLCRCEVQAEGGLAEAWIGPLSEESAREGVVLRVEDAAGNVGETLGPLHPLSRREAAHRVAINTKALSDFTNLLDDDGSSDVVFVAEGRRIHAHRCVLTARCEAFRGMFNSSLREGSCKEHSLEVPVHEVSYAAFYFMLRYLYGGAVVVPSELAVELLGLADRYLLDGLKQLCGFTLEKMVGVESVSRIIQAAERWDSPDGMLKSRCLDYILDNYEAVVAHPVFEELASSPQLLLEITRAAARIVAPGGMTTPSNGEPSGGRGASSRKRSRAAAEIEEVD